MEFNLEVGLTAEAQELVFKRIRPKNMAVVV